MFCYCYYTMSRCQTYFVYITLLFCYYNLKLCYIIANVWSECARFSVSTVRKRGVPRFGSVSRYAKWTKSVLPRFQSQSFRESSQACEFIGPWYCLLGYWCGLCTLGIMHVRTATFNSVLIQFILNKLIRILVTSSLDINSSICSHLPDPALLTCLQNKNTLFDFE